MDRIRRAAAAAALLGVMMDVAAFNFNLVTSNIPSTKMSASPRYAYAAKALAAKALAAKALAATDASEIIYTDRRRRLIEENDAIFADDWDESEVDTYARGRLDRLIDEDAEFLGSMDGFQELQRSTGSEILDFQLQQQIDQAYSSPNKFLDSHVADATLMEKIAMASVTVQLPRPAVNALSKSQARARANGSAAPEQQQQQQQQLVRKNGQSKLQHNIRQKQHSLNFSQARVTHEQELELGTIIQRGVKLHKLRADFEKSHGRTVSRQEWTEIAGLGSANELRRQVSDYRRAKQLLVAANIGLVHAVVKSRFQARLNNNGLSFEELVQEGSLGLIRAAELFDPNKGLRFSTYATIWIKGVLSNSGAEEMIKLPVREKNKWNKIVKAHSELVKARAGAGEPTVEELANHIGMTVSEVMSTKRKMTQVQRILSLDFEYKTLSRSGVESGSLSPFESDKAFQEDADLAERAQMHADVVAALARNLNAREARLMRLRYGLGDGQMRSLTECAEAMGISQGFASRLAKGCLEKLRKAEEAASLEEYLLTIA